MEGDQETRDKGFLSNITYGLVGHPPGYHVECPYPPPPVAYPPPQGYLLAAGPYPPYGYSPPGYPPYGFPPSGYPPAGGYLPAGGCPPAGYPGAGTYVHPWHGHGASSMGELIAGGAAAGTAAYGVQSITHGYHHNGLGMSHGCPHGQGMFRGCHRGRF